MRIIKSYSDKFKCDWFRCTIDQETFSSYDRKDVELWRDDKLNNSAYYKELKQLSDKACAEYYASKTRSDNYTGD